MRQKPTARLICFRLGANFAVGPAPLPGLIRAQSTFRRRQTRTNPAKPAPSRAVLVGSDTPMLSIASKVSLVSPVSTSWSNVPVIKAIPSPPGCPGGTTELNNDVEIKFVFSNACTDKTPGVPGTSSTMAKSNDTLFRLEENEIPREPVWLFGLQSS